MSASVNGQNGEVLPPIAGMFKDYFLDYASYVILERAVPQLYDGLKPVQRRILHAMRTMHDGRFHKVANIIGQTMQYHPHGDAAIGDALVNMGQKDLLIDTQGNWGDTRTGDSAAAPRYIEAKLSPFATDVVFHPALTEWQLSYDGRKKEPIALPVKFPLVLAQGVDGIAVGLSTKILPHNFHELIQASINILRNKSFELYPDFPNGGMIDISNYNEGQRGGKIRCRADIEIVNKRQLKVTSIPYGVTTTSLIDSIIKANDKGKIKIKRVIDNTAKHVEVEIDLPNDVSPDVTISALYAFTHCEVSISPNACIILDEKPYFLSVKDILQRSTQHTLDLLQRELEINLANLREKLLFSSLEKIFIENRIYHDIEECETWEAVLTTIDKGLDPFKPQFYRKITEEDIIRLTEIKIKRISKFDAFKADEIMKGLEAEIAEVEDHLANLTQYAIQYFKNLLKKYGKGKERKANIMVFDEIEASNVAIANEKLYVNRKEGFVGYGLRKSENTEYLCDCSDIDDVIVFMRDGKYMVSRVSDKAFFGKDIIHVAIWQKGDERMVYHAVYRDPNSGNNYVKRFSVKAITRDREYDVTKGSKGSKLLYFTANPNSESEVVTVSLSPNCRAKHKTFDFDFAEINVKGRRSAGNIITKYPIKKVVQQSVGPSTMGGRKIWLDETVGRLNVDERGRLLGEFDTDDTILVLYGDGSYELTDFELTNRYNMSKIEVVEKFNAETVVSAVYYDGERKNNYVKRFQIETTTINRKFEYIDQEGKTELLFVSTHDKVPVKYLISTGRGAKNKETHEADLAELVDVKGWKSIGNIFDKNKVVEIEAIELEEEKQKKEEQKKSKATKAAEARAKKKAEAGGDTLKTGDELEWKLF